MSFHTQQVNTILVNPIPVYHPKTQNIKGNELVPILHSTVYICGMKGSGKSNVLFTLMKHCIDERTTVVGFYSTHEQDDNWIKIKKWLDENEIPNIFFDSIKDEDGTNNLALMMDKIKEDKVAEDKANKNKNKTESFIGNLIMASMGDEKEESEKNHGKSVPKYLFIFDDLASTLKVDKTVETLLKKHRHFKSKVFISTQYPWDLGPGARNQMDIWCLFGRFSKEKLEQIYPDFTLPYGFEGLFYPAYKTFTKEEHNFLYVNRHNGELRSNFNKKILI